MDRYHGPKTDIIQLCKIIKQTYNAHFDINHRYKGYTLLSRLMGSLYYQSHHSNINALNVILSEFKDQHDINNPCLFTICFENTRFKLLRCLMDNYDEIFCIEKICERMVKSIQELLSKNYGEYTHWDHRRDRDRKAFLKEMEKYCLDQKCSTHEQRELLTNTLKKVWKCYSSVVQKQHKEWCNNYYTSCVLRSNQSRRA